MADRVFLDANVLFSAAYRPNSGLRRLWRLRDVELVTSSYAVEEAQRNLETASQRSDLRALLDSCKVIATETVDVVIPPGLSLVEKDRPILAAAIASGASHLLTGDVRHFGACYGQVIVGVLILAPAQYRAR